MTDRIAYLRDKLQEYNGSDAADRAEAMQKFISEVASEWEAELKRVAPVSELLMADTPEM